MVRPNSMSCAQVARMLHVREPLVRALVAHHALPAPDGDGRFRVDLVTRALDRVPWLRRLDAPMCLRELAGVHPGLSIPDGVGFRWHGRDYARLADVLEAGWRLAS